MGIWRIKSLLRAFRPAFTSLESRVLDEVSGSLEPAAREIFAGQLKEINLVQRPAEREVNAYHVRDGRPRRDPALSFPNRAEELRMATVAFRLPGDSTPWAADIYTVRGHFFSIVFNSDPKAIRDRGDDILVTSVRLHQDPLEEVPERAGHAGPADVPLTGWLRDWERLYRLRDKRPPLERAERERLLGNVAASLPEDYLEVAAQCDGFVVGNCSVLGPSGVHQIVMPDADYYVLVEVEAEGVIAVKAGAGGELFYLDYDGTASANLGTSFRRAVETVLAGAGRNRSPRA